MNELETKNLFTILTTNQNKTRMRKIVSVLLFFALGISVSSAQSHNVSGKITDESGNPVPFAAITIKDGKQGTSADANGLFSLRVPGNVVLIFSSVGFLPKEITANANQLNVQLIKTANSITEVVVTTAFGIKRAQRTTPFSSQVVSSENLNIIPQTNLSDALAGKVAGVQFRSQSGAKLNSQAAPRIRGGLALGGDVSPLYVVDGTIVNDVNINGASYGGAYDIDPDVIESVSVLKGANATALFGDRARNGAIIITTKKAKAGRTNLEVSQGVTIDKVGRLAKLQNTYAGGAVSDLIQYHWKEGDPVEWKALDGKFFHDYTDDSSWGPKIEGQEYVPWYAWVPGTKYSFKTAKLVAQPNNAKDFFNTGVTNNTSLNFTKSGEDYHTRLSYTNQIINGIIPGTNSLRHALSTSTGFDLNKSISVGTDINFTTQRLEGEYNDGYANQTTGNFTQWGHRDLDLKIVKELRNLRTPTGTFASWNWYHNPDGYDASNPNGFYTGNYWYNHYTYLDNKIFTQNRSRVFGNAYITAKITNDLKLKATVRKDVLNYNIENIVTSLLQKSASQTSRGLAGYTTGQFAHDETNYELLATYNKTFVKDVNVNVVAGANSFQLTEKYNGENTTKGLIIPDYYAIANSKAQPNIVNDRRKQEVSSVFASADIEYKRFISASAAFRQDWSSTLPKGNNSLVYPSAGVTFIASEFTKDALPWLSFAKVFGSWGKKPLSLSIYQTNIAYALNQNQWNGNTLQTPPTSIPDANLRGSLIVTYETGLDLRFLKNKLGITLTYYNETAKNQPVDISISPVSGVSTKSVNAATVKRQGIELTFDAKVISHKDFSWSVTKTFGWLIKNPVTQIIGNQQTLLIASGSSGSRYARVFQVLGQDWGQLRGGAIVRNAEGKPLVDGSGQYVTGDVNHNWGSVVPKITGGLQNLITYKNFIFNASIDYQFGGRFFSLSESWGAFSGVLDYTGAKNNQGKSVRDAVGSGGGVHVTGVSSDDGKTPVDTYVDAATYFQQFYFKKVAEPYVHKLSFVKLRELSIGYILPVQKWGLTNKWLHGASISVVARNPWLIYSDTKNYDPSEISGVQGEDGQLPPVRSLGINAKFNF